MKIGTFVKVERQRLGWTQQQLADKAEVGLNFVYQLEKNKTTVQLDKTNQVLRALGYELGAVRYFEPWAAAMGDSAVAPITNSQEENRLETQ